MLFIFGHSKHKKTLQNHLKYQFTEKEYLVELLQVSNVLSQ